MANSGRLDESLMQPAIPSGVHGFQLLLKGFNDGSKEVKNLLRYECDIITECKSCRNMFRNLSSFVAHKRTYCKDSAFEQVVQKGNSVSETSSVAVNINATYPTDNKDECLSVNGVDETEGKTSTTAAELLSADDNNSPDDVSQETKLLTLSFLDRWVKRIESSNNVGTTVINVPLHRYPEINGTMPQKSLRNNGDDYGAGQKDRGDSIVGSNEADEEKQFHVNGSLSVNGNVANNRYHQDSGNLSSNLREKRALKSPYDNSEFISNFPKRSKRSPNDISSPPFKKSTNRRSSSLPSKHGDGKNNNGVATLLPMNLDKFPVIFTHKQKEQALAMMDEKHKKCKECGAGFTNKCNMERHCYMHLGFVRFKCSQCDVGSFYRTELRRHLRCLCPNLKRNESRSLSNDQLNRMILPACPDEPGRVTVWRNRTTWGNNFKGRKNIAYKPALRKHPILAKKQPAANDDCESANEDDDDDDEKSADNSGNNSPAPAIAFDDVKSPDDKTLSDIKRESNLQKDVKNQSDDSSSSDDDQSEDDEESSSDNDDDATEETTNSVEKAVEETITKQNLRCENTLNDGEKKVISPAQSKVQTIPLVVPRPGAKSGTNAKTTASLLKPIVKMYKGTDGKVWAKPFVPKP